jgi:hypothetical protein
MFLVFWLSKEMIPLLYWMIFWNIILPYILKLLNSYVVLPICKMSILKTYLRKKKMSLQANRIRYPTQIFIFKFIENTFESKLPNI